MKPLLLIVIFYSFSFLGLSQCDHSVTGIGNLETDSTSWLQYTNDMGGGQFPMNMQRYILEREVFAWRYPILPPHGKCIFSVQDAT